MWLEVVPYWGARPFRKATNIGYVELAVVAAAHAAAISTVATLEAHGTTMEPAAADATSTSSGTRIESGLSFPVLFQSQYMPV